MEKLSYDNKLRTNEFKENEALNDLLAELSDLLQPIQQEIENTIPDHRWLLGFVVGSPRSGTTLLTQWLASLGVFSYPSNFLTRFAYAPYLGAMIQKMIFDKDYDYKNDFNDIHSDINYTSNLGKSKGALAVNEFQHFFRNYLGHFEPKYLSGEDVKNVDFQGIRQGLSTIEKVFNKPFITKAAIFKYNLLDLTHAIPRSVIYYIKREVTYNMQSIFIARQKYYGNTNTWYGSKPKEYENLKELDIYHQIAGQVYFTDKKIQEDLENIGDQNQIIVTYEDFCRNPGSLFLEIKNIYHLAGIEIKEKYNGPDQFESTNKIKLETEIIDKLNQAYENIPNWIF